MGMGPDGTSARPAVSQSSARLTNGAAGSSGGGREGVGEHSPRARNAITNFENFGPTTGSDRTVQACLPGLVLPNETKGSSTYMGVKDARAPLRSARRE